MDLLLTVFERAMLPALPSGTFHQTLPDLVTPLCAAVHRGCQHSPKAVGANQLQALVYDIQRRPKVTLRVRVLTRLRKQHGGKARA